MEHEALAYNLLIEGRCFVQLQAIVASESGGFTIVSM